MPRQIFHLRIVFLCFLLVLSNGYDFDNPKNQKFCWNVYDMSNRTIIKATESIAKGARYLGSPPASSPKECELLCCKTQDCNVAVFQQIKQHDCYMFDCGTIDNFDCIFAVHDNYVAMGMMVDRSDLEKTHRHEQAKHEMDLSLLKAKINKDQSSGSENAGSRPLYEDIPYSGRSDSGNLPSGRSEYDKSRPSSYDDRYRNGDSSGYREDGDRSDVAKNRRREGALKAPVPVMNKDVGVPKSPFDKPKVAPPTRDRYEPNCNTDFQWVCGNGDCIATYDVCNGIKQCRDGSDELPSMCSKVLSRRRPDLGPPPDTPDSKQQNDQNRNGQWNNNRNGDYAKWKGQQGSYRNKGGLRTLYRNEGTQSPVGKKKLPSINANKDKQPTSEADEKSKAQSQKIPVHSGNDQPKQIISVTKEKMISVERIENNTSMAALVLGLGLSLLAVFLVYISCRLRKARSRLRRPRGKVLNSAEGEFLINGMYL